MIKIVDNELIKYLATLSPESLSTDYLFYQL